jgi:CelD/BcsL family acetyltransferase involved in cellulose biosynthesis
MEIPRDWITFKKNLPGRLRNSIQRSQKKAEKTGRLNFEIIRDGEQIDQILNTFFDIEFKSWKGRNGTAIKCLPETEAFYRDLAHWAVSNGSLLLLILKLDDVPIAADYCFICEETIFLLKPAYDESFSNISPGNLLHYKALEYLSENKQITRCNFLGACEEWKMEWTSNTSDYGFIRVYPKSLKGRTQYLYDYGWKNFLKRFDAVRRIKTYIEAKSERHAV